MIAFVIKGERKNIDCEIEYSSNVNSIGICILREWS